MLPPLVRPCATVSGLFSPSSIVESQNTVWHGKPIRVPAGDDRTILLWDPRDGSIEHRLSGHSELVHALAFSPNGERLASGSIDGTEIDWPISSLLSVHPLPSLGMLVSQTRKGVSPCTRTSRRPGR